MATWERAPHARPLLDACCSLLMSLELEELLPVEGLQILWQHTVFQDLFYSSHPISQSHRIYSLPFILYWILNTFSRENKWDSLWLSSGFFCLPSFCPVSLSFPSTREVFRALNCFAFTLAPSYLLLSSPLLSLPMQIRFSQFLFTPHLWPRLLFELLPHLLFMLEVIEWAVSSHCLKIISSRFILGPFHACPDPLYSVRSLPPLCPTSCL